jgi:uncharacterized protein (DUF1697 family)
MPRYLALLRGINVGDRYKVAMADLRLIATDLGHFDVATYIQSGNLLSSADGSAGPRDDPPIPPLTTRPSMPRALERAIAERLRVRAKGSTDDAVVVGRTLFLHTPDGFGRSERAARLLSGSAGATLTGTARNWPTVTRLMAMLTDGG